MLDDALKLLLTRLRPQIVNLAETNLFLMCNDNMLMSAIGNSYGDIYETHFEWAKNSRMNRTKDAIPNGYKEFILPILQGKI